MSFKTFSEETFIISNQYKILTSFYVQSSNFNVFAAIEPLCVDPMDVIPNEGGQESFHNFLHIIDSTPTANEVMLNLGNKQKSK